MPLAPDLYYTAPVLTDTHVWLHSALNGRLHAIDRHTGAEIDFDASLPGIQPFTPLVGESLASGLGEPVIVTIVENALPGQPAILPSNAPLLPGRKRLLVGESNVIVNDAILQGGERGYLFAVDISNPLAPQEYWRRATIDTNPETNSPYSAGVSAGSGLAVDLVRGFVIGGTGQNTREPYPGYPDPALAPAGYVDRGDALYAVDIKSGQFVWVNQFHHNDVFDINNPVPAGPERLDGPRDADVLSPPVMFSSRDASGQLRDLVGGGSKGGLWRVVDRGTGATVWERQISKPTGLGGIQAGAAYANGVVYVAGFEGIDDGFSDANFDAPGSTYLNAFFATFSPAFWADVEDVRPDNIAGTGMRVKVWALDAGTGRPLWNSAEGSFVALNAGANMRHLSVANGVVYATTTSGQLFALNAKTGAQLFTDQTPDLNEHFNLGLGKPHHASMNAGTVISKGRVFVPYGGQNNPSGGMFAYELNYPPIVLPTLGATRKNTPVRLNILANSFDANGDRISVSSVAGQAVNAGDGVPDSLNTSYGQIKVYNRGDNPAEPEAAYVLLTPKPGFSGFASLNFTIQDEAPMRKLNGVSTNEPELTHRPLSFTSKFAVVIF